ncbi:winged helix-turn-helix domain-containing protein [Pseudomonas sp. SAS7]|uniref:winged helix-turn-helix domain-containing protein n=1 Tax=Pseudomonas sp. SAS7 TaxID=3156487 RepID=UPI003F9DF0FF
MQIPSVSEDKCGFGDLALDTSSREVVCGLRRIPVKAKSFRILELLVRHADQVVSRQTIFLNVWGYHFDPGTKVLQVQLSYLRRVLAAMGCALKIDTHRGQGLRLRIFS